MEDRLIIGIDESENKDHFCVLISRKIDDHYVIINEFYDDEARELYIKLTKGK